MVRAFRPRVERFFAIQEELGPKILQILPAKVSEAELRRVAQRYTRSLEAYEYFQRGQSALLVRRKAENESAREMFRRAIALDAAFARAYAGLALTYAADYRNQWTATALPRSTAHSRWPGPRTRDRSGHSGNLLGAGFRAHGTAPARAGAAIPGDRGSALSVVRRWLCVDGGHQHLHWASGGYRAVVTYRNAPQPPGELSVLSTSRTSLCISRRPGAGPGQPRASAVTQLR